MSDQERLLATIASIAAASQVTMEVADTAVDAFSKGMNFLSGAFMGDYERMTQGASGFLAATGKVAGKLLSVGDIVGNRLTDEQKEHLVQRIMKAVLRLDIPDIATLLPLLAIDSTVRNAVFKELKDFLRAMNLVK
ncbi:unnamed protein product [Hermetia illucens]|uniref:Uncharacterized protein n=1 Tax=Hermetia illucens TaxID=343691 RepID=A0A7R8V697_HERIL|nr:uncharacterized protein LOC119659718 [Hermetia illucens]CAD7093641.1 unnamed protein product [Hermetia illucens]